jgi:hypothetical protein
VRQGDGSVARQHDEAVGLVADVGEEREGRPLDALARRAGADRLGDARDDVVHLAIDQHRIQPFLASEVLVDDRLRHLRARGDLLDRGGLEAAAREDGTRDLDELRAPLRGRQPCRPLLALTLP